MPDNATWQEQRDELGRRAAMLVEAAVRTLDDKKDSRNKRRRVALRRALGRAPEHPAARPAHMVVAYTLPQNPDEATERAFYTVAAMIAAQPRDARDQATGRNDDNADDAPQAEDEPEAAEAIESASEDQQETLGATLGRMVATGKGREDTIEPRLHLMCRQDVAGIHRHLPRLIATMRADLVRVDWLRLTLDLAAWGTQRDRVTKRWLQDYYRTLHAIRGVQKKAKAKSESPEGEDQ
ncbi:type I-E CRISPR-associated protein Cse2/CasB [Spongiactinospora rosea]|uniref:Type I-E CRISPR-associated protein Cse2/CasB n=1 Tax=Spongiactinospora rosea TaxID=2248750 RepID=A0A366LWZ8_9ACTN|nr:type I-E CRISPR-associated protein Cse2/CasB [Spongiactinospora rosea]RBQ18063.1 type I-E CRISPR-associated protein Cse2/CasB [Spongiactinospora rosea]